MRACGSTAKANSDYSGVACTARPAAGHLADFEHEICEHEPADRGEAVRLRVARAPHQREEGQARDDQAVANCPRYLGKRRDGHFLQALHLAYYPVRSLDLQGSSIMPRRFFDALAGLVLFAASSTAFAFWDSPFVTPSSPAVGQDVSINIRIGQCDGLIHTPGYPEITRTGTQIRVVQWGQHWDPGELCTFDTTVAPLDIGSYQPGIYTVSLYMRYRDFFSDVHEIHLGDATFVVPTPAVVAKPAPSLGAGGGVLLALVLAAVALRRASSES